VWERGATARISNGEQRWRQPCATVERRDGAVTTTTEWSAHVSIPDHAWDDIEGMDVYTSDEEQIGTVDRVLTAPDDPTQRFVSVRADALAGLLGTSRLYVPDTDVLAIEEDRVVLNAASHALSRADWTTSPVETPEVSQAVWPDRFDSSASWAQQPAACGDMAPPLSS
jgi:hypothetical protein